MTKMNMSETIGVSPKEALIKELNIAFAKGDPAGVLATMSDDIVWEIPGSPTVFGRAAAAELLAKLDGEANALTIETIIVKGDKAAANGTVNFPNGSTVAFCDIYTFAGKGASLRIRRLQGYSVTILG